MGNESKLISAVTFTTELISEGSWGERDLGKHESTMAFHLNAPMGFIEWDIPSLQQTEHIGLWFQYDDSGNLVLTDYDGVHSLPLEAVELLRSQGVTVSKEFE